MNESALKKLKIRSKGRENFIEKLKLLKESK
jgi:hypothetical protein